MTALLDRAGEEHGGQEHGGSERGGSEHGGGNRVAQRGPLHRLPSRRRPGFWTTDRLLGLAVSLVGATVVAWGLDLFPALLGDEGIYTNQARSVLDGQISPYTYTYDHPFFGWLQIGPLQGLVRLIAGDQQLAVVSGRVVMVLYCFVSLLLVFHIARRTGLGRGYAAGAVLLLGLSPLYVIESRQVLLDNVALPWVLGAFYLALNPRRRQWTYGLSGLAFGIGVLSKETVLLVLPALVLVLWTRAYRPIRQMAVAAFGTLLVLTLAVYPLFALLRNELFPGAGHVSLWSNGIMYQLADRKGSGTIWQPGSARRNLLDSWLAHDTGLLLGGFAAALGCLFVRRLRFLGLAILLWSVPLVKPGGYLPSMYVVLVIPFCALAIAGLLEAAARGLGRFAAPGIARVAVGGVAVALSVLALTYYVPEDRNMTTNAANDQITSTVRAEAYLRAHLTKQDNALVDPVYWSDLVDDGYHHPWQGVIAYYQFDLDPLSSQKYLPHGWQDIDWIVETKEMHDNLDALGLTRLKAALEHSTVVARFGYGNNEVLVRSVEATPYNEGGPR